MNFVDKAQLIAVLIVHVIYVKARDSSCVKSKGLLKAIREPV